MLRPANMLGYACTIRLARRPPTSFQAECPALLFLREAPGHAVEESLFDVSLVSLANRSAFGLGVPRKHSWLRIVTQYRHTVAPSSLQLLLHCRQ